MPNDFFNDKVGKEELGTPNQHLILGKYHLIKRDLDGAIREYEKAIQMDPNHLEAHRFLAEACLKKAMEQPQLTNREKRRWLNKAIKHYHRIVVLSPNSQMAQRAIENLKDLQDKLR